MGLVSQLVIEYRRGERTWEDVLTNLQYFPWRDIHDTPTLGKFQNADDMRPIDDTPDELAALVIGGMLEPDEYAQVFEAVTGEVTKHYGPGPHPSGSPQSVHGGTESTNESDTSTSGGTYDATDDEAFRRLLNSEGFSVYDPTGQFLELGVDRGYMVAVKGFEAATDHPTLDWVQRYRDLHASQLAEPGVKWGGWAELQPDGTTKYYMDMSHRFDDREAALEFGKQNDQIAIMDLGSGAVIPVKQPSMSKAEASQFVFVPLDASMSNEEILQAIQDATSE